MSPRERQILDRFRDRVRAGVLGGVRVTIHVSGGFPSERLDQRLVLDGGGMAHVEASDARFDAGQRTRDEALDPVSVRSLLTEMALRFERLSSLRDVAFPPDSLVGRVSIEVDGEAAELFFGPDAGLLPGDDEMAILPAALLAERTLLSVQRAPVRKER